MIKAICIVCFEVYRNEDDDREEVCQTHGLCDTCFEKVRADLKKKREVEAK
jgi:hypothetical protein